MELGEVQLSGCRSQVAPLEGKKGTSPFSDGDETPQGTPWGRRQEEKQLRKGWAGRGGAHRPQAGPGGDPSLWIGSLGTASHVLTDHGAGAQFAKAFPSLTLL